MTNIRWLTVILCLLAVTVGGTVLHGNLIHRWDKRIDEHASLIDLRALPKSIGDWQMESEDQLAENVIDMLRCAGYVSRRYVNHQTGAQVTMAVIAGPHGPISVHVPEICYSAQEVTQESTREAITVSSSRTGTNTFWALRFKMKDLNATPLQVAYAWSKGREWVASETPRHEFAGVPLLMKFQASLITPSGGASANEDPTAQFEELKKFLQQFVDTAWPPSAT